MAINKYTEKKKTMNIGDKSLTSMYDGEENSDSRLNEVTNLLIHVDSTIKTLELEREDLLQEKSRLLLKVNKK